MSAVLYTPEVLALATGLAAYPLSDDLPLRGEARSRSCGSTLAIGLDCDASGCIDRLGLRAQACAIGQAAAAIFASHAVGQGAGAIVRAEASLAAWLGGTGPMPDWPGLEAIAAARAYPARHGAILLAWRGALSALSSGGQGG
ncbi:MAG: iron-sulfur cluster assembly scaffold protein [Sphingomonadales bacterium]|nr:iron-sulfur cluster assembly scaffold protein [Sphingomonadales bacterium]